VTPTTLSPSVVTDIRAALEQGLAGRYRLREELGRGGMATVFLAQDLKHDRPVALKVLHPQLAATIGPERFQREIRVTARLQHPHILTVFDSGETAGHLWFTMPHVDGETLRDRIKREGQLPVAEAVRIAREGAQALEYAHTHGVIHRDIKPENLLLTQDGNTLVADFGIASVQGREQHLTEAGMAIGTPAYMSPEQSSAEGPLDVRSDIYSLGAVLYEMLTGRPPLPGRGARTSHTGKAGSAVPPTVQRAVARALEPVPADRWATAAEFGAALGVTLRNPVALRRRFIVPALVVLAIAVLVIVRNRNDSVLDANLVAVAPFELLAPGLDPVWREGLVDILSRNLDGAGPLRTVSPTVVIRRWSGRGDPTSAAALGRATGAGLAVYGQLIGTGPDSVRLSATLLDVATQRKLGEVELSGASSRVDRLADSLTRVVLRELDRTRPIGTARIASIGSNSLPAVKAFLQGEQYLRRSEWDSAITSYEQAVAQDSNLALAYNRLSLAIGWIRSGADSLSRAYAIRAGQLNHGLAPRDSLLVVGDSIRSVLFGQDQDTSYWPDARRLVGTMQEAAHRYPGDPSVWYNLGETYHHFGYGPGLERSGEETRQAFDRAIALDSAFAPSYIHPIEISLNLNQPDVAARYANRYLSLEATDVSAGAIRLTRMLLERPTGLDAELRQVLDTVHAEVLAHVIWAMIGRWADSTQWAVELANRLSPTRPTTDPNYVDPSWIQNTRALTLAYRGRLREARALFGTVEPLPLVAAMALLGAVPADTVARVIASAATRNLFAIHPFLPWLAATGDTATILRYRQALDSLSRTPRPPVQRARLLAGITLAEGYAALARHDTTVALTQFEAVPDTACIGCIGDRLTKARLFAAVGRDREALPLLGVRLGRNPVLLEPLYALERGRVNERLGSRDQAIEAYGFVVRVWRNADPALQPLVSEARNALARLAREPIS
jgi:serine/threonine protein kinase/tetratricopeptide (TPR) repeat protein